MFKAYQFKWYFILTGILTISSLLLRQVSFQNVHLWEYADFILRISSAILLSWLIHGYFLIHQFPHLNTYFKHLLSIFLAISVNMAVTYFQFWLSPHNPLYKEQAPSLEPHSMLLFFIIAFFNSIICFVVFYSIHTNSTLQTFRLENEILEQAHLRAQLLSLQQQISPHFLFNSLSTLKTITNEKHTKNYVVQLAAVYRYLLNFNEQYLSELKDELTFIKSYLYIMTQRYEEALQVSIDVPDDYLKLKIPPLSLQLLIENAIKHNRISPEQPLFITIWCDDSLALTVENNFQPKNKPEEGTGTGLKNIRERYKLLVNKPIRVINEAGKFSVTLPLIQK